MISHILFVGLAATYVYAAPSTLSGPTVKLGDATFVGANLGTAQRFLGIPFAQPPYAYITPAFLLMIMI